MHADQTHGINDLRPFYINSKKQINIYADRITSKYLKRSFSYIFTFSGFVIIKISMFLCYF